MIEEIAGKILKEDEPSQKVKKGSNKNHITKGVVAKETEIHHDLEEDKKQCESCGARLRCIGEELAYVEMVYHPGYYEKLNHFQSAYVCPNNCIKESNGPQGETTGIKAKLPNKLLPKSSASPSLIV